MSGTLEPFQESGDPAMVDESTRALVTLAHCENLWVSRNSGDAGWLIDGPSQCVALPYGSSLGQWRAAFMRAAGVGDELPEEPGIRQQIVQTAGDADGHRQGHQPGDDDPGNHSVL